MFGRTAQRAPEPRFEPWESVHDPRTPIEALFPPFTALPRDPLFVECPQFSKAKFSSSLEGGGFGLLGGFLGSLDLFLTRCCGAKPTRGLKCANPQNGFCAKKAGAEYSYGDILRHPTNITNAFNFWWPVTSFLTAFIFSHPVNCFCRPVN